MATQRFATVSAAEPLSSCAVRLELEVAGADAFGFVGGQYIIIDTGLPKRDGDGKTIKRAYSLLSSDRDQGRAQLAVRHIEGGEGSPFMLGVRVGDRLAFSGPWGKWLPQDGVPDRGEILVVATDTGITAALGLVCGCAFDDLRHRTRLVWCAESSDYFVDQEWLRRRAPVAVDVACIPEVGTPGRSASAWQALELTSPPAAAYLVGDGKVLPDLAAQLEDLGVAPERIACEYFFNNPRRSQTQSQTQTQTQTQKEKS